MAHPPAKPRQRITHVPQLLGSLAARRRALKLSQKQLADKVGITQPHLSDLEAGRKAMTLERLLQIVNVLRLELLLQDSSSAQQPEW